MNNIFNATRFGKLFMKHTSENYRNYIMSVVVLFGMVSLFYFFFVVEMESKSIGIRIVGLMTFHLLAGCIFTSSIFSDFSQKRKAIASLSLPASHFEKFLVAWVYSFLIFSTIYFLTYAVVDYTFLPFIRSADKQSLVKIISDQRFPAMMFTYYAFLHSIMIYGAIRFQNGHFIKTATVLFVLIVILCGSHSWFLDSLISNEKLGFTLPLMNDLILKTGGSTVFYRIGVEESHKSIYAGLLFMGVAFALWAATFYTLKEKEI